MIRIRHLLSRNARPKLEMKLPELSVRSVADSIVGGIKHVVRQMSDWTRPHRSREATLTGAFGDLSRGKPELVLENALLRHQLAILNRKVPRPNITAKDRFLHRHSGSAATWLVRGVAHREASHGSRLAPSAVQGLLAPQVKIETTQSDTRNCRIDPTHGARQRTLGC
jgi:hypothetical protein